MLKARVALFERSQKIGTISPPPPSNLGLVIGPHAPHPRNFMTGPELPLPHQEQDYSPETAATIDNEVRDIVHAAMDRALTILREKRDDLERSVCKLLEKETLDEKDWRS